MRIFMVTAALVLLLLPQMLPATPVAMLDQKALTEDPAGDDDAAPAVGANADEASWRALAERERAEILQQTFRAHSSTWLQRAAEATTAGQQLRNDEARAQRHREVLEWVNAQSNRSRAIEPIGADSVPQDIAIAGIVIAMATLAVAALLQRRRPQRVESRRRGRVERARQLASKRGRRRRKHHSADAPPAAAASDGAEPRRRRKSRKPTSSTAAET